MDMNIKVQVVGLTIKEIKSDRGKTSSNETIKLSSFTAGDISFTKLLANANTSSPVQSNPLKYAAR